MGYEAAGSVASQLLDKYESVVTEYKVITSQLDAADGNREAALQAWIETSDDAQAVKLRNQIEIARKRLEDLAEKNVEDIKLSDEDKAKLNTLLDSKKEEIKKGKKTVKEVSEMLGSEEEHAAALKALEEIGDPTGSGRGRKPGDTGSSLPRVSVIATLTGGNFEQPQVFDSFSPMAKILNVDVKDIQLAFAQAAGVAHEEIKSVKKPVDFTFQAHENGHTYSISTKPKPRKARVVEATSHENGGPVSAPDFESVNA